MEPLETTALELKRIDYSSLSAKQQENYNFQKVSGVLADYGFSTVRLTADWQGADFVAQHADGVTFLRVQLKGRIFFSKKYVGKNLWVCFRDGDDLYLFPHDAVLGVMLAAKKIMNNTESWEVKGRYGCGRLASWMKPLLQKYRIHAKS